MSMARHANTNQSANYERHQPEQTLLYQLVQQHYPVFKASRSFGSSMIQRRVSIGYHALILALTLQPQVTSYSRSC